MIPYNLIFNFITHTCNKFSIDESHGLKHSMDVFKYSQRIVKNEKLLHPMLKDQERVIYTSALLHDMCDNKYMDEQFGLNRIRNFITAYLNYEDKDQFLSHFQLIFHLEKKLILLLVPRILSMF